MAGVLFLVWIPCESYEQVLSNKQVWETPHQSSQQQQKYAISSDEEINNISSKVRARCNQNEPFYRKRLSAGIEAQFAGNFRTFD